MPVELLDPEIVQRLQAQPFTYSEVGRTASELPLGYTTLRQTSMLATGDFIAVADDLLSWQVPQRAGIRVRASSVRVEPEAVALLRLGFGPLSIDAPCRVVYVVDEPRRQGFAYGTLPGHPECGEESFLLTLGSDDRITFTITAFSRPASRLAKFGGPVGRVVQRAVTRRYLRAIER